MEDATLRRIGGLDTLRVGLVLAQAAMVVQTWKLWELRTLPPNLPLWSWIPTIEMGPLVLATLVLVLVKPRVGLPVHVGTLVVAMAMDQMRLQPEFVSIAMLLVATGPWRYAQTFGRAHIASLWFWAGFAKLGSTGFVGYIAHYIADRMGQSSHADLIGWLLPWIEMGLAVAVVIPATRRWAGLAGFIFHICSVLALGMGLDWAIMPWNLGVGWAALFLLFLAPGDRPQLITADRRRTALVAVTFAYPLLVYVGLLDLYLSWHVYAGDTPVATVCEPKGGCSGFGPMVSGIAVHAIIPPERRLFEQWFRATCRPGQTLHVTGRGFRPPLDHAVGTGSSTLACPRQP